MITDMNINEWGKVSFQGKEIIELKINGQIVYAISFLYSELSSIIPSLITDISAGYGISEEFSADNQIYVLCGETNSINADILSMSANEILGGITTNISATFKQAADFNSKQTIIGILINSNDLTMGNVENISSHNIIYAKYYKSDLLCGLGELTNGNYKIEIEKVSDIDPGIGDSIKSSKNIAMTYKADGMSVFESFGTAIKSILLPVHSDIQDSNGYSSIGNKYIAIIKGYPCIITLGDTVISNTSDFSIAAHIENDLKQADIFSIHANIKLQPIAIEVSYTNGESFLVYANTNLQPPKIEVVCANGDSFNMNTNSEIESITTSVASILCDSNNSSVDLEIYNLEYFAKHIYQYVMDSNNEIGINYKCNITYLFDAIDVCNVVDLDKTMLTVFDTMMVF